MRVLVHSGRDVAAWMHVKCCREPDGETLYRARNVANAVFFGLGLSQKSSLIHPKGGYLFTEREGMVLAVPHEKDHSLVEK